MLKRLKALLHNRISPLSIRLLLVAIMIFQVLTMLLISFQKGTVSIQALILTVALPVGSWMVFKLMPWKIDRIILILVLLLCSVGVIALSSIARSEVTPRNHAIYCCIGMVAMFISAAFIRKWHNWKKWTIPLMILCAIALFSPMLFGRWHEGARNWIYFDSDGTISIQPSEFMKPVLVVILASSFSNHPRFPKCIPAIVFAAICCGILLVERDLGAVLLYFLTTIFMYYAATSNAVLSIIGLVMGFVAAVIAYHTVPLVQNRIAIWRNPWSDVEGLGWQLVQSLIAIGSGGLFGMGLGLGSPRNIPLYHSDFIFASIAEEFGLIFAICLLAVYVLIIVRGLKVASNARTSFHSLTVFGLMLMLGMQTMLIVGGNTKLLPLSGVTLPMVCYGGSSLVSTLGSMGLLLGISSMNAEDDERDERLAQNKEAML